MKKLKLLIGIAALLLGGANSVNATVTLETDLTSQFSALTNWQNWTGATGFTATNFCPMVEVGGGIGQKQVCEKYEGTCATTGDVFYQTVTGLSAGTYTIELYGGAAYTFGRGFSSTAFSEGTWNAGDKIEPTESVKTGVTLYAETSEGTYGGEIPIYYATNFPDGAATVSIKNVVVGSNGEVKIGMKKTSQSTNWHVIQLKSVIATVDGATTITNLKNTAYGLLNNDTYVNVTGSERTNLQAAYNAVPKEETVEAYQTVISALNTSISAFQNCDYAAYDKLAAEKSKAAALGMSSSEINSTYAATDATDAASKLYSLMVAEYNYVTTNYAYGVSLGTWVTENAIERKDQHWDGTTTSTYSEQNEGWGSDSWSCSYSQNLTLPAGKYVFKVAGRKSSNDATLKLEVKNGSTVLGTVNDFPNGDTGLGINTSGATDFTIGDTYANSNNGRGWQWRYVKFELADPATVNVAVTASATAKYNWVGFCNATVQTDNAENVALMESLVALNSAKTNANLTKVLANIGDGVFQYNETTNNTLWSAYETAKGNAESYTLTSGSTVSEINTLVSALNDAISNYNNQALNAPADGDVFNVMITTGDDYAFKNNPLTFQADNVSGAFFPQGIGVKPHRAQQITFTQVAGNQYTMSMVNAEGNRVYVRTNATEKGGDGTNVQIRLTTIAENALAIEVKPTNEEGVYQLWNTEANARLGCQDNPTEKPTGGLYTTESHSNFTITPAVKPIVNITIDAAVKYATRIFPFKPVLPSGVKAYSCEAATDATLTLVEVAAPAANVPYILEAESGCASTDLTGWGTAGAETYTTGWLTGVYTATDAPVASYVLQNNDSKVAFYVVAEGEQPKVGANRCYLTVPVPSDARPAFFFGDDNTTGIEAINALTNGTAEIYNVNGVKVPALQKGMNIVKTANGKTQKILVK